ncbi:DUF3769 domain-containing protein [Nostoc sp. FACHB-110]|uniref:DUF3769 domain-containing protein n=1 Tax=Nostoc sp. FACHB-110 TaxID=2692834 RepID=UPI00168574B1|nr:DUF3769 domain-containing protein [Nostoc sp. FACHB-110]MBD2436611.1 DUF3769 domain-containing protein [Nostoc sp. FACHB-110]
MLHPVLPPAPPPIVEPAKPVNSLTSASDSNTLALIEPVNPQQQPKQLAQTPQSPSLAEANNSPVINSSSPPESEQLETHNIPTPHPPETIPAGLPAFSNAKSAANLGQPLSVGYSLQSPDSNDVTPKATVSSPVNHQEIAQPSAAIPQFPSHGEVVAEITQPELQTPTPAPPAQPKSLNLSGTFNDSVASDRPVQNIIEFKSRHLTSESATPSSIEFKAPSQATPTPPATTTPQQPSSVTPTTPVVRERIVEVVSDRQEYDEQRRIVTAQGNVVVRFDGAVVDADRLQVNLANLIAVGEGNVALTRGDQLLRGQRFTYNFLQDSGVLENGRGEIYIPTSSTDLGFLPTDITAGGVPQRPPSDRIRANQPLTGVNSPGGINVNLGGREASNLPASTTGGEVKRLRFEARHIDFYPRGWQARDVRITNDPFSPPELELRADKVTLTRQAPLIDRITTQRQRLVFDQSFTLPIPLDNRTIDRREQEVTPAIVSPGFDGNDRGGLYLERAFTPINTEQARWIITPQFFVQKAVQGGSDDIGGLFGVRTRANAVFGPKTTLRASGELTSFNLDKVEDNLRASVRLQQALGDRNPHLLNLEYSYRDRLYNGTLGFQTVQSSLGAVITSPIVPLGKSGVNLTYQTGAQYINANTDRQDLLEPVRDNDRISLGRLQASAALSTGIPLWRGKPLAATPTEGLRYTANPVVPYVTAVAGVTATSSYYTSGDTQNTIIGTIGLVGQIGHFSRPFLDYTAFNVSYSQGLNSGLSPFLFDRSVDNRVLSAGITQQIYGPFRLGFQTSVNLDTGKESSTDYILEYSRRTYGITLRYNPVLELGGFSIRISDFNWSGGTDPFSSNQVKPVVGGVRRE